MVYVNEVALFGTCFQAMSILNAMKMTDTQSKQNILLFVLQISLDDSFLHF